MSELPRGLLWRSIHQLYVCSKTASCNISAMPIISTTSIFFLSTAIFPFRFFSLKKLKTHTLKTQIPGFGIDCPPDPGSVEHPLLLQMLLPFNVSSFDPIFRLPKYYPLHHAFPIRRATSRYKGASVNGDSGTKYLEV